MTLAPVPGFAGKTFEVDYGDLVATNAYGADGETLRYEITAGPLTGNAATVGCVWKELGPNLYAISWQEADGATVVHIDDFGKGRSLSFFTAADGAFYRLEGTLKLLEGGD